MKRPVTAVIIGFGDRGQIYANYSKKEPGRLKIVGIVEPNVSRMEKAKDLYNIKDGNCFKSFNEFIKVGKIADSVINSTMDQIHFKTTMPLFKIGYDVLLEKPVTSDYNELFKLQDEAKKYDRKFVICYVLRYAPFFKQIKTLINENQIGDIISINLSEHVRISHMLAAYVRGKWRSEELCGSSMLMAKSSHDTDLICWLNDKTLPKYVSSFGGRSVFVEEKAPMNAGSRCLVDCKVEKDCIYSAKKLYVDNDSFSFLVWEDVKNIDDLSKEQKIELLKTSDFGLCAYKMNNDIVDHQAVIIEFEDKTTATLNMIGGTTKAGRNIHIVGNNGEIEGFLEENKFVIRKYNMLDDSFAETEYIIEEAIDDPHSGGDHRLVSDFVDYIANNKSSISTAIFKSSIFSNLVTIAADYSKDNKRVVEIKKNKIEFYR